MSGKPSVNRNKIRSVNSYIQNTKSQLLKSTFISPSLPILRLSITKFTVQRCYCRRKLKRKLICQKTNHLLRVSCEIFLKMLRHFIWFEKQSHFLPSSFMTNCKIFNQPPQLAFSIFFLICAEADSWIMCFRSL